MASAPLTHPLLEDIMEDILARLPVKSLKRFMCLRKSLCSLIQSPQFISTHFSFSKNKVNPLVKYKDQAEGKNVISIISNQTLDIIDNLDIPSFRSVNMGGCCNGIICLWYYKSDVLLCNVATKEFKTLPKCPFECPLGFIDCIICMGYDCKRDDYKVIRIDIFQNDFKQASLYNLTTDSWKKLDVEFGGYYSLRRQFYSNGFSHYLSSTGNERVLLSFDMSSEVFVTTPLPDVSEDTDFYLMEINGSVGGMSESSDDLGRNTKCYDVWVLSEVGVENSWIRKFAVCPMLPIRTRPLGVGSDDKVFFEEPDPEKLLVHHHPGNRKFKIVQIHGYDLQLVMYAESLFSLRVGSAANN